MSGVALNGVSAHHQARIHGGNDTMATLLGVAAVPLGAAAMWITFAAGLDAWPIFALAYLGVLMAAYRTAGSPNDAAVKRSVISTVLFPVAFGLELAGGIFLVVYVFPLYLLLAAVVMLTVIPTWSAKMRDAADRAILAQGDQPFDPATYDNLMPPPPTNNLAPRPAARREPPTPPAPTAPSS